MSVTLSLRVTCDKRKPGIKPQNTREENLLAIITNLRTKNENLAGNCEFLDKLESAIDLKTQLETLRKGQQLLTLQNEEENHASVYFHVLVEILLSLELKSPLRSGILRILKEFKDLKSTEVEEAITEGFKARFSTHEYGITLILGTANAVCGCFDNFPLGVEGVRACIKEAHKFIVDSFIFCTKTLSEGGSAVKNTEVCQCTHALVRAALHVISLDQSAGFDKSQLHQLAKQLMTYDGLPLDTRTNCGLLAVATGRPVWLDMLQEQLRSEDDLTSLCLYSGIIGCLSKEELSSIVQNNLGEKTPIQLIFDRIINIHKRNPLQPTITLSVARTLVSLSRVMVASSSEQLLQMLPALLSYTWEHLEHVMDSVKHLAVTLLNNIVKLHSPQVDVYSSVLRAMTSLPTWSRARHTALSALLGKVPVSQLISGRTDVQLMYQHLSKEVISSHAVSAFQELMRHHYKEITNKEEWKELWIQPLLSLLDKNPSVPLQQVLSKAVAVSPDITQYILKMPKGQVSLGTMLLCLRLSHRLGLLDTSGPDGLRWRGVVSYDVLRTAVQHTDEQTRLSSLSLVVEAPKTTEVFTSNELKLIVEYVSHNLNWDSPAARQRNIALLGKFVSRFNDSHQALQRRSDDEASLLMVEYTQCKQQLQQCCVDNLFPGATYSRRVTALHLLIALRPSGSPQLESVLLACLADSYEEVKAMAVKLLTTTPELLGDFNIPSVVLHVIEVAIEHTGGVKPPDCLSAAYLLAVLSRITYSQETLTALVEKYPYCGPLMNQDNLEHKNVHCLLLIVADELTQQLAVAQTNLLKASASGPLHGLLFTVRLLLTQVHLKECNSEAWRQLIRRFVDLSFSCSEAVASVVNNDSPEGHFPMDFDFDPTELCGSGGEKGAEGVEGVTSQMVLLCSWRTVKEVSLLLGHLVEECSIATSQQEAGLLYENDVLRIGHHLTTLLAETKHRGAFEQAYVGFCKLVSRLWKLPIGHLQKLPLQWLQDTMEEISTNQGTLCATRRSAGIPFMIQALICTQLEVQGPSSVEPWVCRLLELAECATLPPTTHTHALNILRALFRSTQLGEAVTVCVERAFVVTITAFSANNWMERNSATLLLSALMTRVFGVPRSKSQDSLSWKNKMTGRIFFQRYPKLFGFFQQELQKGSQCHMSNLHPSLYPVLLILGRLYPSSLEGTDSNVQLTQYIPDIVVCSGSNIYKTRTLAARAMVALMTLPHFDIVIGHITQPGIPVNLRHGLLLQVAYFLKQSDLKLNQSFFKAQSETWLVKLMSLFEKKLSCLELEALFDVLNVYCEKYFVIVPKIVWVQMSDYSKNCLKMTELTGEIGYCLLRPRIYKLLLKLSIVTEKDDLELLCCEMLKDGMYEVRHTILDFINYFCIETDYSDTFSEFYKTINSETKYSYKTFLLENSNIIKTITQITLNMLFQNNKEHPEDKVKILLVLRNWEKAWIKILESSGEHELFTSLLDLCRDSHDEVATNAVCCLVEFLKLTRDLTRNKDTARISKLLEDTTSLEKSYLFDEPLHKLITKHFNIIQQSTQATNKLQLYKVLVLLSDDSQWPIVIDRVIGSEKDVELATTWLLGLTLGQFITSENDQSDNVGKVFDKEEISSDYEEYMLSRICSRKFNELRASNENMLDIELGEPIRDWLAKETGLNGNSLAEVIALARMKVLQLDTKDPCQFLNSGYQRLRLNCLKLKYIV